MLDCFNKNRGRDGYVDIESLPKEIIERKTYGSREDKIWFAYQGDSYLFKPNQNEREDIKEILNEELGKSLGIQNAEYDLGFYEGKKGVISKDYITDKSKYLLGIHVLFEYHLPFGNNLYNYYQALLKSGSSEIVMNETIDELLRRHILDIFTVQRDRNETNLSFYKTEEGLIPAPRYDSAGSFLSISKTNKMREFIESSKKEMLMTRYKGIRTKFRILPGSRKDHSIDEFFHSLESDELPIFLKERILSLDSFITDAQNLDLLSIYDILEEYNIHLCRTERDFYRKVYDYKIKEFEQKKAMQYVKK